MRRDHITGEPAPLGNLIVSHTISDNIRVCRYLNQRLALWAGVPPSRPFKGTVDKEGTVKSDRPYDPSQMPPFAFGSESPETLDDILISQDDRAFFKPKTPNRVTERVGAPEKEL
uniref:Wsv115-like protein n=1 Tax=Hemigrapsus takanoi nimavirus TaxID=2133792 RepID=A0A401IP54_9VIRU|nr:MAG: wsv115-like protein [Hemigrapsus takanoi nimavirus]GBG35381.1 wsv115-like protein [Hemigrapsus takanoi nimavirus]